MTAPFGYTRFDLIQYFEATFDSTGVARLQFGPSTPFSVWHITSIMTTEKAPGGDTGIVLKLYRGTTAESGLQDGTYTAEFDFSDCDYTIKVGEQIYCVWTPGTQGNVMSLRISGDLYVRGNRGYGNQFNHPNQSLFGRSGAGGGGY